jgi:hypothetical protein
MAPTIGQTPASRFTPTSATATNASAAPVGQKRADSIPSPAEQFAGAYRRDAFEGARTPLAGGDSPATAMAGVDPYAQELRGMTDQELQAEKLRQQALLTIGRHSHDPDTIRKAQFNLQAIAQEERFREAKGRHDAERALYTLKLHGMSDRQLGAEERKQQQAAAKAFLAGDQAGVARAKANLEAIQAEKERRGSERCIRTEPQPPPYGR